MPVSRLSHRTRSHDTSTHASSHQRTMGRDAFTAIASQAPSPTDPFTSFLSTASSASFASAVLSFASSDDASSSSWGSSDGGGSW
jgi:hypothetical protein